MSRPSERTRVIILATLLAVTTILASFVYWTYLRPAPKSPTASTLAALREKYGRKKYSQHDEETIIRDFFKDRRGGVFVDVGASHYRTNSTTFFLERHLGWSGIAIDALENFRQGYEDNRPRTRFLSFFVSDKSDTSVEFFVVQSNDRLSTGDKGTALRHGKISTIETPTITLTDLLDQLGVERIDFLSMDIELAEPKALAGFDIKRFRPALICIEAHPPILEELQTYFAANDYVELAEYSAIDPLNRYFTPRERR